MKKNEALKKWAKELADDAHAEPFLKSLEGKHQSETIEDLQNGINKGWISIRSALIFALIVGVQWHEKFEG